jgi:hypothetical protein
LPARIASNRISFDIPDDDLQAVEAALRVLHDRLRPHLVALGAADRRRLARMGAKSVDFVAKNVGYARQHPELMPRFLDVEEFERDFAAVATLRRLQRSLAQLHDLVDGSALLSGSEAYATALGCYHSIKAAAKLQHPAAATIAADLATRFPGRPSRPAPAAGDAGPDAPSA